MPGFYREVDYVVILSRTEAHCRVIIEAMLAGVIVLASPTCASTDLITDDSTGLLIRPDDPADVRARLAALTADPGRDRAIRERAARYAVQLATDSRESWRELLSQNPAQLRKPVTAPRRAPVGWPGSAGERRCNSIRSRCDG